MSEPENAKPNFATTLSSGLYLVGLVRGIVIREVPDKKHPGQHMRFCELAVERDNYEVQKWSLTKGQQDAGWENALEKIKDKLCMIPVSVQKNGDFVNYRLRGLDLPKVLSSQGA